jgi:D-alanyl-lipoteichoic acid acyltransferase DltB (MBOAT superfamily)
VKKLVIADRAVEIVRLGFGGTTLPDGPWSWLYLYAFAFQIYGDFSGYSDIARGLSRVMGFELMTNFRAPYLVTNPSAFWRHWHISLSTWLRDYLYIPLGGNRTGEVSRYRNLLITMVLGGLWHGAGWAFLLWGVFHGVILIVHRIVEPVALRIESALGSVGRATFNTLAMVFFFHVTCIGWLLFRAGGLPKRVDQLHFITTSLQSMFTLPAGPVHTAALVHAIRVLAVIAALAIGFQAAHDRMDRFHAWGWSTQVAAVTCMITAIAAIGVFTGAEFIYFQF